MLDDHGGGLAPVFEMSPPKGLHCAADVRPARAIRDPGVLDEIPESRRRVNRGRGEPVRAGEVIRRGATIRRSGAVLRSGPCPKPHPACKPAATAGTGSAGGVGDTSKSPPLPGPRPRNPARYSA